MQILRQFCDYVYVWWVLSASNLGTVSLPASSRCVRVNKVLRKLTSGLRILTKGRIAPALVTPARRMSPFWSVAFISPWRSVPADKSTAPCCCGRLLRIQPNAFQWPVGGSGPLSKTRCLGPTRIHNPSGISIGSAVCVGLTSCVQQTAASLHSVHAMRPNRLICWPLCMRQLFVCLFVYFVHHPDRDTQVHNRSTSWKR